MDPAMSCREWDRRTAQRVTHFIAISRTVQRRIEECYGRSSTVIYPPVNTDFYCPAPVQREHYYLVVSAFAPYKRLDLAVEACNRLRRRLVIIGTGQDERRIRALAGPMVELLGWQPEAVIRHHLRRCRALLFPGEEDFGIVPVEAQACGAPVIAFGQGGATETVLPPERGSSATGMWFEDQTRGIVDCCHRILRSRCLHVRSFCGPESRTSIRTRPISERNLRLSRRVVQAGAGPCWCEESGAGASRLNQRPLTPTSSHRTPTRSVSEGILADTSG